MSAFYDRIDAAVAADHVATIGERQIAMALVGDDGKALAEMGINGTALVEEVTRLERAARPMHVLKRLTLEGLHPTIREVSGQLFTDGHYESAIFHAYRALEIRIREMIGLEGIGRDLVARALGGEYPRIRITSRRDQIGKDEQEGFRLIFMGAMQGIRNPKAHDNVAQDDPQRTLEYLALGSLLMRRLDDAATGPDRPES